MKISIHSLSNDRDVLSGSIAGRRVFAALVAGAPRNDVPTVVFLDFAGVTVATSSFLRESVLGFRDACSQSLVNVYPVVANANDAVIEELQFFLRDRSDALWCCDLSGDEEVSNSRIIGSSKLEGGQRQTLEYVQRLKRVSAPMLFKEDDTVKATGWNNRLSSLADKRLLMEQREGKSKIYSAVLEQS